MYSFQHEYLLSLLLLKWAEKGAEITFSESPCVSSLLIGTTVYSGTFHHLGLLGLSVITHRVN